METKSKEELLAYLKKVRSFEEAAIKARRGYNYLEQEESKGIYVEPMPTEAPRKADYRPKEPKKPDYYKVFFKIAIVLSIFFLIALAAAIFVGFKFGWENSNLSEVYSLAVLVFAPALVLFILGAQTKKNSKAALEKYAIDYRQYEEELVRKAAEYQRDLEYFNVGAKEKYERDMAVAQNKLTKIHVLKENAGANVQKIQEQLSNLYSEGVIYKNYRAIIPVNAFIEYIESGRCETLEGPNGCYNKYDAELQANLIQNEISVTNENLARLKQVTQNILFEAQDANASLSDIRQSTEWIATHPEEYRSTVYNDYYYY